jgi:D-aspartate ligase
MFQELRCDPIGFGPASVSTPVVDEETDEICDRFLSRLGYKGICEIEMKRDLRDGRVKLIEVNPRLSGGGDAAPYAGVDLCWLHYLDLVGEKVALVGPRKREFRHIVLRADARAIPAYRRAGLVSWRDVFRSYRPPLAFFDIDRRDWRYSAETLLIAARSLVTGTFASPATRGK